MYRLNFTPSLPATWHEETVSREKKKHVDDYHLLGNDTVWLL
jgi:hypothetical protein